MGEDCLGRKQTGVLAVVSVDDISEGADHVVAGGIQPHWPPHLAIDVGHQLALAKVGDYRVTVPPGDAIRNSAA